MNVIVYGGNLAATLPVVRREVALSREDFIEAMCGTEDAFGFFFAARAMDAIETIRDVRELGCHAPLVVLMDRPHHTDIANCLNAGADQVERADLTFSEVRAYLEAIPRRGKVIIPDEIKFGDFTYRKASRKLFHKSTPIFLGETKSRMLLALICASGPIDWQTLSIAMRPDGEMEMKTVQVHMLQLRRRFRRLCPDIEYFTTAYKFGYRFAPEGVECMRYATGRLAYENRVLTWAK